MLCASGYEQDESKERCVMCSRGFYRDDVVHVDCQPCPSHLTTPGPGATSVSECSQGECKTQLCIQSVYTRRQRIACVGQLIRRVVFKKALMYFPNDLSLTSGRNEFDHS